MSRGSRGRRYEEPKLNMKKVFAVILANIVIIMVIFIIKGVLTKNKEQGKIASKDYFAAFKDNKWGVIDETGSVIIDPSYSEMIIVPNSKNDVFLCTYDVDYTTGTYKTKALNSKNEEIFKDYDKIEAIQNKDEKDNLWYEDDVLKVEKNGKYGIIDLSGKELLSCEYDQISALSGIKNALKILKDGKYGIVDDEGKVILKTEYADITNLGKDNKSGYIVKNTEGKYGIVDFSGNIILDMKYDEIAKVYGNDYYVVKKSGKQILVKKDGTEILTTGFDEITEILKNIDNGIIYKKDNKYGVMKTTGEVTIEEILQSYDSIVEKIIKEQITIPYETVTKDVSTGTGTKQDKVVQKGEDGIKEITYKAKYQNDVEIEKVEISSEVIKEPVNKIVEVRTNQVTSRASTERKATSNPAQTSTTSLAKKVEGITPTVKTLNASAYTASTCGKAPGSSGYGRTSSGAMASSWYTVAAGSGYKLGTVIYIPYFANKPNGGWLYKIEVEQFLITE